MYKKVKLLLTLACLWTLVAQAQNKGSIELGIGGGVNIAGITDGIFTSANITAFNIGASGDLYFSDRWSIKAKILYDVKGWKSGYLILNGNTIVPSTTYKLDYITVPVMANWHFGKRKNWYLNFGPYLGILTNNKMPAMDEDDNDRNKVDAGIALGIGVKIPLSERCKLFIEYDGQGGLTNIIKNNNGASAKNIRVGFNAGVCVPLK